MFDYGKSKPPAKLVVLTYHIYGDINIFHLVDKVKGNVFSYIDMEDVL